MPENESNAKEAKREISYHANVDAANAIDQAQRLTTNIGFTAKSDDKYEVYFMVPTTDEEAQARYDCDLKYLIEAGVRQIATRVNYKDVGFAEDGSLKDGGHQAMQDLADGYRVGRVATGTKKEMNKAVTEAANAGLSADDVRAAIAAFQKKNKK